MPSLRGGSPRKWVDIKVDIQADTRQASTWTTHAWAARKDATSYKEAQAIGLCDGAVAPRVDARTNLRTPSAKRAGTSRHGLLSRRRNQFRHTRTNVIGMQQTVSRWVSLVRFASHDDEILTVTPVGSLFDFVIM